MSIQLDVRMYIATCKCIYTASYTSIEVCLHYNYTMMI